MHIYKNADYSPISSLCLPQAQLGQTWLPQNWVGLPWYLVVAMKLPVLKQFQRYFYEYFKGVLKPRKVNTNHTFYNKNINKKDSFFFFLFLNARCTLNKLMSKWFKDFWLTFQCEILHLYVHIDKGIDFVNYIELSWKILHVCIHSIHTVCNLKIPQKWFHEIMVSVHSIVSKHSLSSWYNFRSKIITSSLCAISSCQ